jgi:MFS superfamily sulfate permease-like transporter
MFAYPKEDAVAGVVVFLVALPLCLGIAVACGVPPVSGLVAGVVGGIVVPFLSRSPLSVTGPAAGLTSIVLMEVERLGGLPPFLTAVVIAGVLQAGMGLAKAGRFATLVPGAVIQGMLAAIGATIVLKQLPTAFGVYGGTASIPGSPGLADIPANIHLGATLLTAISLVVLFGWKHTPMARFRLVPPALIVVVLSTVLGLVFRDVPALALAQNHYVRVPLGGPAGLAAAIPRPDFSLLGSSEVWIAALTLAVVASIESLLSVQAVDRLDPLRRQSPPDRELVAQGVGNAVSGLLGGLPVTSVIVRSSANVAAGGRERLAAVFHGVLLGVAVLVAGSLLNQIPLACLAAVLLQVGFNLCKPATFAAQAKLGRVQFLPFLATIGAVLATDLLKGVIVGIAIGVIFVLHQNAQGAVVREDEPDGTARIRFRRDGTFLVKPALVTVLGAVTEGTRVVIDGRGEYLDHDVKEAIAGFLADAPSRGIHARVEGVELAGVGAGGH